MKNQDRRKFLKEGLLYSLGGLSLTQLGALPFNVLKDRNPGNLARFPQNIPGKHKDLVILNDRPWNAETPAYLLNEPFTSGERLFVRNNGLVPQEIDEDSWTLEIGGESVVQSRTYSLQELKTKFPVYTYALVLECGGNGRAEFNPPAKGNQWTTGAVGCPKWTGIRLRDLLEDVGIKDDAVYVAYYGKDTHLSGDPGKEVISRGVPIEKALENESLIAWEMNGKALPLMNGFPLRLVFGGWPGSVSGKWLSKIVVRNKIHDGPKMGGQSYRVPCKSVAPGTKVADEDMCIIESMPVKSLITSPKTGGILSGRSTLAVEGKAWAGDLSVKEVHLSIDFGASWQKARLKPAANRLSWHTWEGTINFPAKGYYEIWARAVDQNGNMQPMVLPGWNPRGYLNNACHRIAIKVV